MHSAACANTSLTPWNIVSTFASGGFNFASGVAVDGSGTVYVADSNNNVIKKITPAGTVSVLAGSGVSDYAEGTGTAARFSYPEGVGVDVAGTTVYVADSQNGVIRKIDTSTRVTSLVAGSPGALNAHVDGTYTTARFAYPTSVAVDSSSNLYIGDTLNHCIRKIAPGNVVTTLAGGGGSLPNTTSSNLSADFNGPNGVAVDAGGTTVYVADTSNSMLRKIYGGNTSMLTNKNTTTNYNLYNPYGVAVDSLGVAYIGDTGHNCIHKTYPDGTTVLLASIDVPNSPGFVNGVGAAARFNAPWQIATDPTTGSLYIADRDNGAIRKIDTYQIYINSTAHPTVNSTITLEANTVYTRMDSDAGGQIATAGHTLTFGKNDGTTQDSTFNGIITGTGNLVVNAGVGKSLRLTGANTYSGTTTVSTGTLIGTLPSSTDLSVASGAIYELGSAQTIGTLSGQGNIDTGGGAGYLLTIMQGGTSNFQGVITGNGGVVKNGGGTLEFSGANNYTGLTVVQNGAFIADATTIPGPLQNDATVTFNQTADGSYTHNITGNGNFNKQGNGKLTLTGDNTGFSGTTTVTTGEIIGSANSMPGTIVNNATINFAQTSNGAFTRNISGNISGVTQKTGNAVLTLTGNNTGFLGTTTVSNGTLRGNVSSLLGANIAVSGGANVIIDQPTNTSYTTTFSGAGNITKEGAGTLTLTGNHTHTGDVIVNNGRLNINGTTTATTATVNNGGILGGTGTINGTATVMSGGSVYAGNSIGQLNVATFNLNAGGYINAEFTTHGTLPLDANLINVAGTATIDQGYVRLIPDLLGTYAAGDRYTIVRAANPLVINNGGIVGVIPAAGFRFNVAVQYDLMANEVQLLLLSSVAGYTSLVDPDTNEGRVAYDLEHTQAAPGSDLETIFTNLNPLSNPDLIDALSQMHVFRNHSLAIANHNLYRQAADLISMHSKPLPLCPRQPKFQTVQDLVHVPTSNRKSLLLSSEKRDISTNFINFDSPVLTASGQALPLWVAGFANLQRQRMQKEYLGYNSDAGAVLTGIHLPLQDNWGVGVTIGYGQTALEWAKDQGKVRTDHYIMGLSGYWTKQQYFLEGIVLGGFDRMDSKRYLRFSDIRRKAKGNINGIEGGMQLTAGMDMKVNGLDIQPFMSMSTFKSHYKRYTERGASSMNLTVKGQNSTYVFTRIGTVFSQGRRGHGHLYSKSNMISVPVWGATSNGQSLLILPQLSLPAAIP